MRKLPHIDLYRDYDLCQAFHKLGERMFPGAWTGGNELHAKPTMESSEAVRQKRAAIETRRTEINQEIRFIGGLIAQAASPEKKAAYEDDKKARQNELHQIREHSNSLPRPDDIATDEDVYERRSKTEERLIGALHKNELTWWATRSKPEDRRIWEKDRPGFHYDIELSCIWWPRSVLLARRQFVRLHHAVFDDWLERNFSQESNKARKGEAWFRLQMQAPDHPRWRKTDYEDHIKQAYGIGTKAFKRLWDDSAPGHMRKPGRRKSEPQTVEGSD